MRTIKINWQAEAFDIILDARKAREDIGNGNIPKARTGLLDLHRRNERYHDKFLRCVARGELPKRDEAAAYLTQVNNVLGACLSEFDETVERMSKFYRGCVN